MPILLHGLAGLLLLAGMAWPVGAAPADAQHAASLRARLAQLVQPLLDDGEIQLPGLQVGIVTPAYTGSFAWGSLGHLRNQAPKADTLYEIASFTKPFVATLVSQAAREGKIRLEEPLAACGPHQTSALCFDGQGVTWLDLLTHSSGLPDMPDNLDWNDWQATRSYTREQLGDFLATYQLHRRPGRIFSYSSVGYAILGRRLEALYRQPLERQLQRLTDALGMRDTRVALDHDQIMRLAPGYQRKMPMVWGVHQGGMTASGGLKSTMQDMLVWLDVQLGKRQAKGWSQAIVASHQVTERPGAPLCNMALGWLYFNPAGWYWHSGSAPGFKSFIAFDVKKQTGVVILANARITGIKMEPVGIQIMNDLNR